MKIYEYKVSYRCAECEEMHTETIPAPTPEAAVGMLATLLQALGLMTPRIVQKNGWYTLETTPATFKVEEVRFLRELDLDVGDTRTPPEVEEYAMDNLAEILDAHPTLGFGVGEGTWSEPN